VLTPVPTIEVGGAGPAAKATAAARSLAAHRRIAKDAGDGKVLVLWPAFGHLEPLTWPSSDARISVVVHDPAPLRRQHGLGTTAARVGARAAGRVETIVLSEPAQDVLDRVGWGATTRLPIPTLAPRPVTPADREGVAVLGQFKPARDLEALRALAGIRPDGHRLVIAGRGWPQVDGWERDDRFLPEDEFQGLFDTSAAVIIPYRGFFQSGVAVRALEAHTPVVAPRHPMVEELLGKDWPGLVDHPDDWRAALDRALQVPTDEVARRHALHWDAAVEGWSAWASR
jgi:hypothetical protein